MGLHESTQDVLASPDHPDPALIDGSHRAGERLGPGPIHLYPFLSRLMSTAILGISAFYHDSAAALLVDGRIVAAAHEERFSRKKHDAAFPAQATRYVLSE